MNSITFAIFLTSIAGLSTLIGIIPIYLNIKNTNRLISISLSFAAGVMSSVSIFSLIPESYHLLNKNIIIIIIFILIGMLLSNIIDKLFNKLDNKLYKLGVINTLALILHNIPEGILTFSTASTNITLGITLAITIIFHNIPEGLSISIPVYYSTNSKKKAWYYVIISGFSEVFGAIITYLFLYKYVTNNFIGITLALTTGIMLYLSLNELMPNSLKYNYKKTSYISFLIGFLFMILFK